VHDVEQMRTKIKFARQLLLLRSTHSPIYALESYAILKGKKYNNNLFKRAPNFSWRERQGNEKKVA
jgi:hypothetical protein